MRGECIIAFNKRSGYTSLLFPLPFLMIINIVFGFSNTKYRAAILQRSHRADQTLMKNPPDHETGDQDSGPGPIFD